MKYSAKKALCLFAFFIVILTILYEIYSFLFLYYSAPAEFAIAGTIWSITLFICSAIAIFGGIILEYWFASKGDILRYMPIAGFFLICLLATAISRNCAYSGGRIDARFYHASLFVFIMGLCALVSAGITFLIIYRKSSISKTICKIVCGGTALFLLTALFPTKFCLSSLPQDGHSEYYIINPATRRIIGDNNGLYQNDSYRQLSVPAYIWDSEMYSTVFKKLSREIWNAGTLFIIYGTATAQENGDVLEYTIDDIEDWDIYGSIKSLNRFRSLFSKSYLTIYDYYWFDYIRDDLFGYFDGHVSNF